MLIVMDMALTWLVSLWAHCLVSRSKPPCTRSASWTATAAVGAVAFCVACHMLAKRYVCGVALRVGFALSCCTLREYLVNASKLLFSWDVWPIMCWCFLDRLFAAEAAGVSSVCRLELGTAAS